MSSIKSIKQARLKKLENIQKAKVNPYPAKAKRTHTCQQVIDKFEQLMAEKKKMILVGRLRTIRQHGGSTFAHIEDGSAKLQIYLKRDELNEKKYKFFLDNFDIGDFIEAKGMLFLTKKGEKTLLVKDYRILAKSLVPLPEKWHGLKDVEERFRKRYLDLLMNKEVRNKFLARSQIIKVVREFLEKKKFIEVETPILQTIPGGALARPFQTHHHALDMELYLRIAPELYLKRLLIGGLEKVYEIGRCFRNEGLDAAHNPDFTMLEFYWAYADYEDLMEMTEEMFEYILFYCHPEGGRRRRPTEGSRDSSPSAQNDRVITYQGKEINFKRPWKKIEFTELGQNDEEVKEAMKKIIEPTFIIHHPVEISPLARQLDKEPSKAARFQLVVGGLELVNAFSELNDPLEQKKRFKEQEKIRQKGNEEAQPYDQDFIEALEYGLPPAAGFGLGLDRLVALLTDSHSLREVILFPLMKPK
jgi:lysyl-tRNA synthetase class 2